MRTDTLSLRIFLLTFLLIGVGLALMYGASGRYSEFLYEDRSIFFQRHLIYGILSIVLILIIFRLRPDFFLKNSGLFLLCTLVLLVLVLVPGIGAERKGARRWIPLGWFHIQPSEIAKVTLPLYLAQFLGNRSREWQFKSDVLPVFLVIGTVFVLVFVEEDFSTAGILLLGSFSMLFVAGLPIRYFLGVLFLLGPLLYFWVLSIGHIKARLLNYLGKFVREEYVSYQERQAIKAMKNADFFGNGLGIGSFRSRVPEAHTDFYFISVLSDLGFVGGVAVLLLFLFLFWSLFSVMNRLTKNLSYVLVLLGLSFILVWQTLLNLASVIGLLPIAGIPLPFLSFGGNALLSASMSIGLILGLLRYHGQAGIHEKKKKNDYEMHRR